MISVGIRELKNRLSECVRRARGGEVVLVTDRGTVVARLTRPGAGVDGADDGVARLEADGLLSSRGGRNTPDLYPDMKPLLPKGGALDLLDDLRGER
ncbi:MAG: type II toxin-antitoxin system prevent-host-death family antitoxin [Deltaproteobacteria bacterium]|nr:type II toxin-antitoxin system prevent-host-death family antitoxin [Deltaproteobacteria bacterium]